MKVWLKLPLLDIEHETFIYEITLRGEDCYIAVQETETSVRNHDSQVCLLAPVQLCMVSICDIIDYLLSSYMLEESAG